MLEDLQQFCDYGCHLLSWGIPRCRLVRRFQKELRGWLLIKITEREGFGAHRPVNSMSLISSCNQDMSSLPCGKERLEMELSVVRRRIINY